jgi:hypothetical protein
MEHATIMARSGLLLSLLLCVSAVQASQVQDLRAEFEKLRGEINHNTDSQKPVIGSVESSIDSRYGPAAAVSTKDGTLRVGGLLQVWFYVMQQDHKGIVQPAPGNNLAISEPNGLNDRSTFRIRRSEINFSIEIHEYISAYVMIDPARESNVLFTPLPTFSPHNSVTGNFNIKTGKALQGSGNTIISSVCQDAYISYHGIVPHHDFTIGQFKPPSGEEAWRNSGYLDFVDRSLPTAVSNVRDIGVMAHGTWWDNRFQYWAGIFDGPTGTILAPDEIDEAGNRPSTQEFKNIAERIAVRPVWNADKWYGRFELGYSRTDGENGTGGNGFDSTKATNGLNRQKTAVNRQDAWVWYRPGNAVRGWWFRGEWASFHDRFDPRFRTNLLGTSSAVDDNGNPIGQLNPAPITQSGWYFSTGYKISDSRFSNYFQNCDSWRWVNNLEFAFRYESFQNVAAESPSNPDRHTNLYKTQTYTAGINYYVKKYDARIQLNGIAVDDPEVKNIGIREIKNNLLVLSFQVMF